VEFMIASSSTRRQVRMLKQRWVMSVCTMW
jgi:hypothetical protein